MTDWSAAIGCHRRAREFVESAGLLEKAFEDTHTAYHAPSLFLTAHGLELHLKAILLLSKSVRTGESYGHEVRALFDDLRRDKTVADYILGAETHVRNQWKALLRSARDEHTRKLVEFGLSPEDLHEFGGLTNEDIGAELPELRSAVLWLAAQNSANGGVLRYFAVNSASVPIVTAFGLSVPAVPTSIAFASEHWDMMFRCTRR